MESSDVQVSIIMPVFNSERYLREAVESVLAQTFPHWELLMIDDGSTDQSGKICDEYAQRDSRIRVFHTANGGVSCARNLGIEKASGKWLTFLDSDDYMGECFLETLIKYSNDVNLVICSTQIVPAGVPRVVAEKVTYYASQEDTLRDVEKLLGTYFYADVWNKLYVREKVTMRFDAKLSIGEDLCFNAAYMRGCHGIRAIPDVLNYYRVSSENSLTKVFRYNLIEDCKAGFYARMRYLGKDSPSVRNEICHGLIERIIDQSVLLARSRDYSLREKKAVLDHWANNDLWKDDVLDLSAARNKRHQYFLGLLKQKRTWTALLACELFAIVLDWKEKGKKLSDCQ